MPTTTAIWKSVGRSNRLIGRLMPSWPRSVGWNLRTANAGLRFAHALRADEAVFTVQDEGPGFDTSQLPDVADEGNS